MPSKTSNSISKAATDPSAVRTVHHRKTGLFFLAWCGIWLKSNSEILRRGRVVVRPELWRFFAFLWITSG